MDDVSSPDSPPRIMGRRSRRLTLRLANLAETPDDDVQGDSEYEQPLAESFMRGKKRKYQEDKDSKMGPSVKKLRGKRGLLRQLVEMPLDLLFEIFGHLKPLDLLHLARTTKDLRAILMNRSSTSIWKHARSQFDQLPDCPDDLSEPQYAELLFGKACTFCHRNLSTNTVIWTSRVRSCSRCLSNQFSSNVNIGEHSKVLLEYVEASVWVKSRSHLRERNVYPVQLSELWGDEYYALKTVSGRSDWLAQKIKERKAIKAHAKLCEKWVVSMKHAQEMERTALIGHRKAIIMERVKALGWADELSKMDSRVLETEPYVEKTCQKDITGRVLINVDSFINTFMEAVKAKRLRNERDTILENRLPILRKVYDACVSTYPINSIIPCSSDVFLDPFVHDLIISPPLSATFTDKDLAAVKTTFPDIVLRWRKKVEEQLLNMITQSCATQNTDESVFQLATTIFSCRFCYSEPLTYPRVLVHRCTTKCYYQANTDEDVLAARLSLNCSYWNSNNCISFEEQRIVLLTEVIKLCGLDPRCATREDINKQNPIFECLLCNDERKGRCTLSFLGVFVHLQRHHPLVKVWNDLKLKFLEDEEAIKVRDRMAETLSHKRAQISASGFHCVHCKQSGDVVTLAEHVNQVHKITKPSDKDIVPALDYSHFQGEYWLWPPRPVDGTPSLIVA